jgi:Zn-dependent alcohol dehydrogenase
LFLKDGLLLPLEPSEEQKRDKHVIVWGAATGSGMFAIQALKAQGYQTIIAVASRVKQKEKLVSLGATEVFDRNNAEIANEIKAKYPKLSDGLVCQIDPQGWSSLLTIVKPDGDAKQNPATIAHIIRRVPPEVPQGVTLRRTVAFVLLQDPLGDSVIAQILPKLLNSPNFQLPKPAEVVTKGTLLERVQAAMKVTEDNTEVSVVVKVQ